MSDGLEVADVFRDGATRFEARYGHVVSREQRQVIRAVTRCRTAALGGHVYRCQECGHEKIQYNSCRNRHCPKCQAMARAAWLAQRESELLPIPYFHLVFTIPHELGPLALQNKRVVYGILFRAAAQTAAELAADPKHLGAKIGCMMVPHTWGQNLMHHPHVHAVVSGGGISADGTRWVHCKKSKKSNKPFFIPVRVLSAVFRGKFIAQLKQAYASGQLVFHGRLKPHSKPAAFQALLRKAVSQDWVVYAKRPFSWVLPLRSSSLPAWGGAPRVQLVDAFACVGEIDVKSTDARKRFAVRCSRRRPNETESDQTLSRQALIHDP